MISISAKYKTLYPLDTLSKRHSWTISTTSVLYALKESCHHHKWTIIIMRMIMEAIQFDCVKSADSWQMMILV